MDQEVGRRTLHPPPAPVVVEVGLENFGNFLWGGYAVHGRGVMVAVVVAVAVQGSLSQPEGQQ